MSLKLAEKADQRSKDLVFGYIRECNHQLIVLEINLLCLIFYYCIPEKFIKCASMMKILSSDETDDKKSDMVKVFKEESVWIMDNAHGNLIINPRNNPEMIVIWTIKINAKDSIIGIHSNYDTKDILPYGESGGTANYGWWGAEGQKLDINETTHSVAKFEDGDTIKMELNLSLQRLRFYRNGKLSDVGFNDIDMKTNYHMMMRFQPYKGSSVQLIDFDIQNYKLLSFFSE